MNILRMNLIWVFAAIVYLCESSAIVDEEDKLTKKNKLSDKDHYVDLDNDQKLEHNAEYDHETFLGKDEADKFKELTPGESKSRLAAIQGKIDVDKDGFITESELHDWIVNVTKRYHLKDVETRWKVYDPENRGFISLDSVINTNYGSLLQWSDEEKIEQKELYETYMGYLNRDKDRFAAADGDKDGKLNKTEYGDFLHPEESKKMRDIVINESLIDVDKNKDGFVDIDEFKKNIYPDFKESDELPEWVKRELENFNTIRDKDSNGKLDRAEVAEWILPEDYDHTLAEAKHLIYEADEDQDNKLSKDEVLNSYHTFVASQATAYGEAIYKHEDL